MVREEIVAHLLGYVMFPEKTLQSLPFFHSIIVLHYLCCRLNRCGLIVAERSPSGSSHRLLHYTQNSEVVGVHQNAGPLGVFLRGGDVNPGRISL